MLPAENFLTTGGEKIMARYLENNYTRLVEANPLEERLEKRLEERLREVSQLGPPKCSGVFIN
jgi:hypothetical protein